jgi:hypothetical protein
MEKNAIPAQENLPTKEILPAQENLPVRETARVTIAIANLFAPAQTVIGTRRPSAICVYPATWTYPAIFPPD